MNWKNLILIAFTISIVGCTKNYKVIEVVDGDTFIVYPKIAVRLIGVDAPELKPESVKFKDDIAANLSTAEKEKKIAFESKQELIKLLMNKTIILKESETFDHEVLDNGRAGRLLRFAYISNIDVGKLMIQKGLARSWGHSIQYKDYPHTKEAEYLKEETIAKESELGLWKISLPEKTEENAEEKPVDKAEK